MIILWIIMDKGGKKHLKNKGNSDVEKNSWLDR